MEIVDSSTGTTAAVDLNRRLQSRSVVESEISDASHTDKSAFTVYGRRNFLAANTNENIFYLKYTGSHTLKISSITFSSNSSDAKVELYFDPVYTSGGTLLATDQYINNQNRQSSKPLDVVAYHGSVDLVMTVAAFQEVMDVRLSKSTYTHTFGGIRLGKNDTIGIIGSVGVIGEVVRVMIECFEVDGD